MRAALSVIALAVLAGSGGFSPTRAAEKTTSSSAGSLQFSTRVEGEKLPDEIKALLNDTIGLGKGQGQQPATLGQLRRRAGEDAVKLNEVLRSEAYYNGGIEPVIEEADGGRFLVVYRVTLGPRTMIRSFRIVYPDHPSDMASLPQEGATLGLKPNRAARAQRIIDLTKSALDWLENHGHPKPKLDERKVIVDLAANLADVTLTINAGPPKRFGNIAIDNADGRTTSRYVRSLVKFKRGDLYDRRKADATVTAIRESNLFSEVAASEKDDDADNVVTHLKLSERPRRSIGLGTSWSSDEGAGVNGFWEHRNIFGGAESLRLGLSLAQIEQLATAAFRKPRFLRGDQTLLGDFEIAHEDTDAYAEKRIKAGAAVSRKLLASLEASVGVTYEIDSTRDSTGNHSYRLAGFPLTARYDGSNDLLDPTEGARIGAALTPYAGISNGSPAAFNKLEFSGSTYWSFGRRPDLTLAIRGRYGSMFARQVVDVPGSIRFYAGGGGSIRGYGYQLVGPLDVNNKPLGGLSVVEVSTEARMRVTRDIGLVAFIDGGNAYSTAAPKINQSLLWGAGLGVRYYTPIGPVRADIGIPLNRRHGVDDAFQLYFSLGQSF